jgi:RES domain-containing protein
MLLHRITDPQFADDLSGEGARLYGGRWNPKGIPLIYTAESVALAALEVLVRLTTSKLYHRVTYELPEDTSTELLTLAELPSTWNRPFPNIWLMEFGKSWAMEKRSLMLKVPSAVVNGEGWNCILNPLHPQNHTIRILNVAPFAFDPRLTATLSPRNDRF